MPIQLDLFNRKAESDLSRPKGVKNGKTLKQLYEGGRTARTFLTGQLQALGEAIGQAVKPDEFHAIIARITALKETPSYKTIILCDQRNAFWWRPDCDLWMNFLIQRDEMK